MQTCNVPENQYVRFITPYEKFKQNQIPEGQYNELEKCFKRCKPINSNTINLKYEKIKARALQLQKEGTTINKIPYQVDVAVERWNGDLGKIFGSKKTKIIQETRYHDVPNVPAYDWCYHKALK